MSYTYGGMYAKQWAEISSKVLAEFADPTSAEAVKQLFTSRILFDLERTAGSSLVPTTGGNAVVVPVSDAITITGSGSASQAFTVYANSGGAISGGGAATGVTNYASYTPIVLEKTGTVGSAGFASPLGVLSVDVGVVGAAIAPILGVAIGAAIYELAPEFMTKISQTLIPWAYPDTEKVPIYCDKDGNTYIDGELIEALKDMFIDGNINPNQSYESQTFERDGYSGTASRIHPNPGSNYRLNSTEIIVSATADVVCRGSEIASYGDGTVVIARSDGSYPQTLPRYPGSLHVPSDITFPQSTCTWDDIGPILEGGTGGDIISVGLPDGTSKWGTGQEIDYTQNPKQLYTDDSLTNARDVYPISLPPNGQISSIDDSKNPLVPDDPNSQSFPYSMPDIVPYPNDSPNYNPEPNPETKPQTKPDKKTTQKIRDIIPPIDTGDSPTDPNPIVPLPTNANVNGLIAVYHPTPDQLYAFSRWLWVTYADASNPNLIWNNPFDGVIGCHELYCTPTDIGYRNIQCGFLDSGINSAIISRYTEINCGNIVVPEYYRNYLDYAPYTSVHMYLPFVGIVQLNADDIIGHAVNVTYRIDEYNGSCIAMISCAKTTQHQSEEYNFSCLQYQFEGNCSVEVPLSGGSQANIKVAAMTGILQIASSTLGGTFSGGLTGGLMGAAQGLSSAAQTIMHAKSSVQKSGQFGASYGAMGVKNPFIIVNRPVQVAVLNYNEEYGFPAHKFVTIGACTGYLRCREVNVISSRASNEEKVRIEQLLKSGVFVQ